MQEPERRTYGYARVSTDDQDLTLQREALIRYGVPREWIYEEHASGGTMERQVLKRCLRSMRDQDTLVVWKLDRLGRTLKGVLEMLEEIERDGIKFVSITEGFDTKTAMGRAMLQMAMVFAELERSMISERTKAGMAARKAADPTKKWGSKHFLHDYPERMAHVQGLYNAGEFTLTDRPSKTNPGAMKMSGMTAETMMAEINALKIKGAREVRSPETVRRWLRDGAPGLTR